MIFDDDNLILSIDPYDNQFAGTWMIEVKVEDDNSENDTDGNKFVVQTFQIIVLALNHPCTLDNTGITTTGFSYELGIDR